MLPTSVDLRSRIRWSLTVTAMAAMTAAVLTAGAPAVAGPAAQRVILSESVPPTADFTIGCFIIYTHLWCELDGGVSTPGSAEIVSWSWEFADGSTGSGESIWRRYEFDERDSITLTVTDEAGLSDSVTKPFPSRDGLAN
jgi:PKD repeat protein